MVRRVVLVILFVVAIFSMAGAQEREGKQENEIDMKYNECLDKDTSAGNIYTCSFEAYARWNKVLDRAYDHVLKSLKNAKDKAAFKQAQDAWIAYRDKEFKAYDNMFNLPGAKWVLLRASGRIDIVRTRALQLELYYEAFDKKSKVLKL